MDLEMKPVCGLGACQPRVLRKFASIRWFTAFYSVTGLLTTSLSMYMISQITTIERQFGLSSTKSGYLMACNDIGYSAFILISSYVANRVHIPRYLAASTILYGISGIICSIPHFIYKPDPLTNVISNQTSMSRKMAPPNICLNTSFLQMPTTTPSANVDTTDMFASVADDADSTRSAVAMAFIATGMVIQGIGKAPRYPMVGQYVDDNTRPRETGFYMGIITTLSVFGPAIAYGLGALFSRTYVTLEDVELHPRDPRWIGAWWLGFLVFGVAAVICAFPLALFPAQLTSLRPPPSRTPKKDRPCFTVLCSNIFGIFKTLFRTLSYPVFTIMLIASILIVMAYGASMSFGPKYLEVEFNVPAWQSNIIIAAFGIIAVCIGIFSGGVLTKKLKLSPFRCSMLMFLPQVPTLALQMITMFIKCDQPRINNWEEQQSSMLPSSCNSDCACSNAFLPVCDGNGTNYFSPCHAGCTGGSFYKFTNCSCVPGGEVSTGLCEFQGCSSMWLFLAINFLATVLGASLMMPTFIFTIRIVPNDLKSMAIGLSALATSLFGWLPGPVIGGKLVDAACILWSGGAATLGSCSYYNLETLRYNMYGMAIACKSGAIVLLAVIVCFTWNMHKWPNKADEENEVDFVYESYIKQKPGALLDTNGLDMKEKL
ncbi:SO2B1-like protein [Mya arenaria]|uniref:Solute carrier organic anion transporter family member n=1 Tax=Mya arenaria TaxID=6604 RepID=A0ABY7DL36_MYAAR|nr:solute carrier organic anion transporter family member 2B1-like [Mya arenaria]WAQ95690.1 SO2B1-like protein [Mya arenaria]